MDRSNGRDENGRITPQRAFEESWVNSRTYAANVTRRLLQEHPGITVADLLAVFELEQAVVEKAFSKRVNSNGAVVDTGGPWDN